MKTLIVSFLLCIFTTQAYALRTLEVGHNIGYSRVRSSAPTPYGNVVLMANFVFDLSWGKTADDLNWIFGVRTGNRADDVIFAIHPVIGGQYSFPLSPQLKLRAAAMAGAGIDINEDNTAANYTTELYCGLMYRYRYSAGVRFWQSHATLDNSHWREEHQMNIITHTTGPGLLLDVKVRIGR